MVRRPLRDTGAGCCIAAALPALLLGACAPAAIVPAHDANTPRSTLYVTNKRGNDLSVVDLASGTEMRRVETCANPHELALSPDGAHLAVACYAGTRVDILATAGLQKAASIELGENARPHGIVWHDNGDIYVTAEGRKSIFRVKDPVGPQPETFEFSTGKDGSHMLAVSPDARHAWTMDLGSGTVTLVDLVTRRAPRSVAVGVEPEGIDLSPDGSVLWVSARGSNTALELEPMTLEVRREIGVGRFPLRLAIRPQGDVAVTSNLADGSLTVIDLASGKPVRTIAVSSAEEAQTRFQVTILWSDDGQRVYVAETGTDTVAEIDYASGTVIRRIKVGDGGDGLALRLAAGAHDAD